MVKNTGLFTKENALILVNSIAVAILAAFIFKNSSTFQFIAFLIMVAIAFGKGKMSGNVLEPIAIFSGVLLVTFLTRAVIPRISQSFQGGHIIAGVLLLAFGVYILAGGVTLKFGAKK